MSLLIYGLGERHKNQNPFLKIKIKKKKKNFSKDLKKRKKNIIPEVRESLGLIYRSGVSKNDAETKPEMQEEPETDPVQFHLGFNSINKRKAVRAQETLRQKIDNINREILCSNTFHTWLCSLSLET